MSLGSWMTDRGTWVVAAAAKLGAICCGLAVAAAVAQTPLTAIERDASIAYSARLAALSTADPESYLKLAEEVGDAAGDLGGRRLAIRLYALAYEWGRRGGRTEVAGSALIGLTSVVVAERDRQWLSAVSRVVDPRQAGPAWISEQESPTTDAGAYQLATLLGSIRAGEGVVARRLLEQRAVRELAEKHATRLGAAGHTGGLDSLTREANNWPCRECSNARTLRRGGGGNIEYRLCPNCLGNPGPRLTTDQLASQLRFESFLLGGRQRSWASQLGMDFGAPLIQVDPSEVCELLGVDARLAIWRDGEWRTAELPEAKDAKPRREKRKEGEGDDAPVEPPGDNEPRAKPGPGQPVGGR